MEKKIEKKKSNVGKIVLIIVIVLLLSFLSMIVAGFFGIIIGLSQLDQGSSTSSTNGNVAVIYIKGVIVTESAPQLFEQSSTTSSTQIVKYLDKIKKDPAIKAVIFEINSPGGSGVASDEISQAISSLNKTTVSYVRDVGASGAYWVASATDHIFVNRLSFVGSIGVIGSFLDFSGLMEDYNVSYERFVAGKYKDFGSPFREPSEEERELFQSQLDIFHEIFIEEVAKNRNMSTEQVTELAHGFVFPGVEAINNGLADEIGARKEAIKRIEELEDIEAKLVEYKKPKSFLELLGQASSGHFYSIGQGIGDSFKEENEQVSIMFK